MSQEILNLLLGIATTIITGLISLGFALLTRRINRNAKNEKEARLFNGALDIIEDAVMETFQVYVENLKNAGKFDEAAQKQAKDMATKRIMSLLTEDMKTYIIANFGDLFEFISNKIETTVYNLKR